MADSNQTRPPGNGLGITALILGIIGVLTGLIPLLFWLAAVLGIIALILGIAGARRASQGYATNGRMSVVGAVLGALAIVLAVIGVVIVADVFEDDDGTDNRYGSVPGISSAPWPRP